MMNRAAVKLFFRCAHFLARQHIPHNTNFEKLVELVVLCGGADLKSFLDRTGGNAVYTSHIAVVEVMEALGTWIEEFLLKHLHQASCFSIMADECIDVATIEEMSVFCRWEEEGSTRGAFFGDSSPEASKCREHLFCSSGMLEREKSSGEQNCWNGV